MRETLGYLLDRRAEMGHHLELLHNLDKRSVEGGSDPDTRVEVRQVLILKSGVLVHLYNIVEATMNRALDAIALQASSHHPKQYTDKFFEEWVKTSSRVHVVTNTVQLLQNVTSTGRQLIAESDWQHLKIHRGSGNWDDSKIDDIADRLGVDLTMNDEIRRSAREHYQDDLSRMKYLRKKRNFLAHGYETFEEGAMDRTAAELTDFSNRVLLYMEEVVHCFSRFDAAGGYLRANPEAA